MTVNTTWSDRTRWIVATLMALVLGLVVYLARNIIPNLIIAGLMAVIAEPIISVFHNRFRMARGAAIALIYLLFLIVIISLPILFLAFLSSLVELGFNMAEVIASLREWLIAALEYMQTVKVLGVPLDLSNLLGPVLVTLENLDLKSLMPTGEQIIAFVSASIGTTANLLIKGLGLLISIVFAVFITFTYAVYMSAEGSRLFAGLLNIIPPGYEFEVAMLLKRIGNVWKSYIVGQLGVMVAVGLVTWAVAWLLGLPEALALAVIAGVLEIIPNLGPILAAVPAVIIALFHGSTRFEDMNHLLFAIFVALAYTGIQKMEDMVLTPKIQGRAVELPALVVIISVMVGFHSFGFLGAIIAVPVTATGRELFSYGYSKVLRQTPYPKNDDPVVENGSEQTVAT